MRTTVTIEDALLRKAREASVRRNCTLGEVIEDALRITLNTKRKARTSPAMRPLKTFRGSGVRAGVVLSSSAQLLDLMES